MSFCRKNFVFTLIVFMALSISLSALTQASASSVSDGAPGANGKNEVSSVSGDTLRYVCSRVRSNNFDDVIKRLEKKSFDIVDVYFTISCGSDVNDSTILEIAVSLSNKEFVTAFIDYLKDRDEWDRSTYTDMILNRVDVNGESLLDYIERLKSNARDDSPREAVQWYIDYFKENGAKHSIELLERGGNYISPVIYPSVTPEE